MLRSATVVAACFAAALRSVTGQAAGGSVAWFAASDTHLGHDVGPKNGTVVSSYEKNVRAISEMNALWASPCGTLNCSWPASLGGGPVQEPLGVVVSGDLIDNGGGSAAVVNGCNQWYNFTSLFGFNGSDGMLRSKVYEGRGNHDDENSTAAMPPGCTIVPSRAIIARNKLRLADASFGLDAVSPATGLHYSWTWPISSSCRLHFVQLNLYPGETCGSPANPGKEGTFPCADGWIWGEGAESFLVADLAAHAAAPGTHVVVAMHFGLDGWSRTWYNPDQAAAFIAALAPYKTLVVHVGHTHAAGLYSFNGTDEGAWNDPRPGFVNVMNAPATQKEAGDQTALPSEFMALEATVDAAGAGTLRIAQRVGSGWGNVQGSTTFSC